MSCSNSLIEKIERRYDPEHDLVPDAPDVTYTDFALLEIIKKQQDRIATLEATVADLAAKQRAADEFLLSV